MALLTDKIFGSLLGLVLGDAIGARFEGLPPEQLRSQFTDKNAALEYSIGRDSLRYTDDGQMALVLEFIDHLRDLSKRLFNAIESLTPPALG